MLVASYFEETANLHCYTSCTLTICYTVAKCNFLSVVTWKDIIKYLQKCEGFTLFSEILYTTIQKFEVTEILFLLLKEINYLININRAHNYLFFLACHVRGSVDSLLIINRIFYWASNQHIKMISEGSCDTEDWSNDPEYSALHQRNVLQNILK